MADEPDSIVPVRLGRMDEKLDRIDTRRARLTDDLHDLEVHTTSVEEGTAGVNRRLDRMEMRVDRIEHCSDLVEPGH